MKKKTRVFVVSAAEIEGHLNGNDIDIWNDTEKAGEELPEQAKKFIKNATKNNRVYSLKGFMVAYNINEEIGMNDWIFITKAY